MNCKEIQTATKYGGNLATASVAGVEDHIRNCHACRNLLLSEKLAPAIIKAASANDNDSVRIEPNAMLIRKIKRRIQEIRDQRSSSWEAAVEATSGWLAAFAVAAIVLVVGAIQWRPSMMASDLDFVTQNADEHIISDIPATPGAGKDNPYVTK
jgi:predicted anti-sigma-YlaC factor YlaD